MPFERVVKADSVWVLFAKGLPRENGLVLPVTHLHPQIKYNNEE